MFFIGSLELLLLFFQEKSTSIYLMHVLALASLRSRSACPHAFAVFASRCSLSGYRDYREPKIINPQILNLMPARRSLAGLRWSRCRLSGINPKILHSFNPPILQSYTPPILKSYTPSIINPKTLNPTILIPHRRHPRRNKY